MTTSGPATGSVGPPSEPIRPRPGWSPQQPGPWGSAPPGTWNRQVGTPRVPGPRPAALRRRLRVGVPFAVAGVVGLGAVVGSGGPAVGDCVRMQGDTDVEIVDCGSAEAGYRIVGVEDEEQTYPAYLADPDTCADFPSTEVALWIGGPESQPGTVLCTQQRRTGV